MKNFQLKENKKYGFFSVEPLPNENELNENSNINYT